MEQDLPKATQQPVNESVEQTKERGDIRWKKIL